MRIQSGPAVCRDRRSLHHASYGDRSLAAAIGVVLGDEYGDGHRDQHGRGCVADFIVGTPAGNRVEQCNGAHHHVEHTDHCNRLQQDNRRYVAPAGADVDSL